MPCQIIPENQNREMLLLEQGIDLLEQGITGNSSFMTR
jgi:hypothetical protein